jgi:thiol-disulfide isomerase/thioredoxin
MDPQSVHCPEFLPGFTWLNTRRPLTVSGDLRGRVTVLDFWTYCCINCMHVLPVLRRLEEKLESEPFCVIGVHSAKFISEKDPENIRRALRRYRVVHPVVVDSDHDIWERFAVRAWPTLVLVDAEGYVRDVMSGEAEEEPLAAAVEALLSEGRAKGVLADGPLDVAPDPDADRTFLRFPGKVAVDGDRLFIADSGHNRIVIAGLDGRVRKVVGEGGAGAHDGPPARASFHDPQGMALAGGALYVADTGNHLIRSADLESLEVRSVAGTGERGMRPCQIDPREPRRIPLRSPWALLSIESYLMIAMAGSHQIWVYDTADKLLGPWAGTGREDHIDGPAPEASFAQPSGLALAGGMVFVADSEVSSVRAIDMSDGLVRTVVGRGLFDFGDLDGPFEEALLQHPLDVAASASGEVVYVADTYNNKIKEIALRSMEVRTLMGDGRRSLLHEPGGIAAANGSIFIADTNNHRVLRADPATGALEDLVIGS